MMPILSALRRQLVALAATVAVLGALLAVSAPAQAQSAEASAAGAEISVINLSAGGGLHIRLEFTDGAKSAWIPGGRAATLTTNKSAINANVVIKRWSTGQTRGWGYLAGISTGNTLTLRGTWDAPRTELS